ncbi:MAG: hypothetical protein ACYC6J_09260 [Coriobacteriia bacterium]
MDTDKTSIENESQPSCLGVVSGSLLSFEEIMNEAKRVKENIKAFPFHDVSFQYGAEWSRDTLIEEIKRRQEMIISETNGIVRETMIANLLVELQ